MTRKPRKPIADLIRELQSWLPNYDHGPEDYPTVLFRILASAPGGDRLQDMGYEPFNLGWQELDQLGKLLVAIQDKRDVEDLVEALTGDDEEEESERLNETGRRQRGGWWIHWSNHSENGPFTSRREAKIFADHWSSQRGGEKMTFKIDQVPGHDERTGPRPHRLEAAGKRRT